MAEYRDEKETLRRRVRELERQLDEAVDDDARDGDEIAELRSTVEQLRSQKDEIERDRDRLVGALRKAERKLALREKGGTPESSVRAAMVIAGVVASVASMGLALLRDPGLDARPVLLLGFLVSIPILLGSYFVPEHMVRKRREREAAERDSTKRKKRPSPRDRRKQKARVRVEAQRHEVSMEATRRKRRRRRRG